MGAKFLSRVNHDTCHPSNNGGRWSNLAVYRKHFENVVDELEWEDCLLHHMPYFDEDDDRFPEYRPINNGKILIHGHVHQRWVRNGPQINVGVDAWDFTPVSEEQLRELISKIQSEEYDYCSHET